MIGLTQKRISSLPSRSLAPCTAPPRSRWTTGWRSTLCLNPASLWISPTAPGSAMRRRKCASACLKVGHDKRKVVCLSSKRWNCLNSPNRRLKAKVSLKERRCNSVKQLLSRSFSWEFGWILRHECTHQIDSESMLLSVLGMSSSLDPVLHSYLFCLLYSFT